jgi:hypothetical protein
LYQGSVILLPGAEQPKTAVFVRFSANVRKMLKFSATLNDKPGGDVV